MLFRQATQFTSAVCCAIIFSANVEAAPIEYRVAVKPSGNLRAGEPFYGASFELAYQLDTSVLTPLTDRRYATEWPSKNSTARLKITGDATYAGEYTATRILGSLRIAVGRNVASVVFPISDFELGDVPLRVYLPEVWIPRTVYEDLPTPLHARPFTAIYPSALGGVDFATFRKFFSATVDNIEATVVPEPKPPLLLAVALLSPALIATKSSRRNSRRLRRPQG